MTESLSDSLSDSLSGGPRARLVANDFRRVMGQFASGVTIVSTRDGGRDFGATASAFTSLSLDPPMVLACLFRGAATEEAIRRTGRFGISILRDDQGAVAECFASRHPNRFATVDFRYGEIGVPLIENALAHVECRVSEAVKGGTHTVFLGSVHSAVRYDGRPLAYFAGNFGHFLVGDDAAVYGAIRAMILVDGLPPGSPLSVRDLAETLSAEPSAVLAALKRLGAEKRVARDPEGGYVVGGLDLRTALDMISASRTIEVGVAELTVGWVDDSDVEGLARLVGRPCQAYPRPAGGPDAGDGPDFHERLVALAGNARLLNHYRELSTVAAGAGPGIEEAHDDGDHAAIVAGYREGNLATVISAIDRHARRLREAWQQSSAR
ncbi:flavin reductase [Herbidospora mongoliensis]|uniref:flavin reductase n=1 Tax=Herbidospora mongoliensis TaxID=688067 RepID=UPI0012FA47BC|nr:flavin reductase [Herbidospora mongoliensis]